MVTLSSQGQRGQQGFTLVELAIVLVIVGLLIGGILKGQELVGSTRVTSVVTQVKAIEAATNTFFDTYGTLPGDLPNANTRLPNCATAGSVCNITGDGNGRITQTPGAALAIAAGNENTAFFGHLAAAELLSGVRPDSTVLTVAGGGVLGSPIGGGSHYRVGYHTTGTIAGAVAASNAGHYLLISGNLDVATAVAATNLEGAGIQPKAAQKIDSKYDDGNPTTGSAIGANTTAAGAAAGCANGNAYNTQNTDVDCGVYVRFYQ